MAQKISNDILLAVVECSQTSPTFTASKCETALSLKQGTIARWKASLKKGAWGPGYGKTQDGLPLTAEVIQSFLDATGRCQRSSALCNEVLSKVIEQVRKDPFISLKNIAASLDLKVSTLSGWHKKFRDKKWPADYAGTRDGTPLDPLLSEGFVDCFKTVGAKKRIIDRLVTGKCLRDSQCFGKQYRILDSLLHKYPSLDFWLYADFGSPVDDLILLRGKNEVRLKQKYDNFNGNLATPSLQFKKESIEPPAYVAPPTTPWDYYNQ